MGKNKRDGEAVNHDVNGGGGSDGNESEKRNKKKKKNKKNNIIPTVSIALPGSIIDNTQSFELATRVIFLFSSLAHQLFDNIPLLMLMLLYAASWPDCPCSHHFPN